MAARQGVGFASPTRRIGGFGTAGVDAAARASMQIVGSGEWARCLPDRNATEFVRRRCRAMVNHLERHRPATRPGHPCGTLAKGAQEEMRADVTIIRMAPAVDQRRPAGTLPRRLLRRHVQDLPIGIVVKRFDLNFDRRRVAVGRNPAKPPLAITGRSHLRVVVGRPIPVSNAATRANRHVQQHHLYPQSAWITFPQYDVINTGTGVSCHRKVTFA